MHTKSVTLDGGIALFGAVNLDVRRFWLDSEVTLLVYDADFGRLLRRLQRRYLVKSDPIGPEVWQKRSMRKRFIENAAQLFAPLL